MSRRLLVIVIIVLVGGGAAGFGFWRIVAGGCGQWDRSIGRPGMNEQVRTLAVYDDGNGPSLFAGGFFSEAGGRATGRLARWDGERWHAATRGINGPVRAMTVFDDGSGPALYVAGQFTAVRGIEVNRIVRYDGEKWSPLGSGANDWVLALTVHDDGNGPNLYAAGLFTMIGGEPAACVARWDGEQWHPLGQRIDGDVYALATARDANGEAHLYAAGAFRTPGDVEHPLHHVARWDGERWRPVGDGLNNTVYALTTVRENGGNAERLIAGGRFTQSGELKTPHVAQWNGSEWSPIGEGLNHEVQALTTAPNGALYAGGRFTQAGEEHVRRIARWDRTRWMPLKTGVDERVQAFTYVSPEQTGDGLDAGLYVGGSFTRIGMWRANRIARWRMCDEEHRHLPDAF